MITDILPDEFYMDMAKAMNEVGEGCIQFTQSGASESSFGVEDDFKFLEQMTKTAGRPLLYNALLISDKHPESHRAQLNWSMRRTNAALACSDRASPLGPQCG